MGSDEKDIADWYAKTLKSRGLKNHPARLYKFLSVDTRHFQLALHELLLHNRIYLSSRLDFNDPFDSLFGLDIPEKEAIPAFVQAIAARQGEQLASDFLAKVMNSPEEFKTQTQARILESLNEAGIFSMSDRISHPLLWAHYASAHKGLALIFRHGVEDCMWGSFPIRYQSEFPRTAVSHNGLDISGMLCKGSEWSYEGEWRIVEPRKARQWHELLSNALLGIVFGARCTDETYAFVDDLLRRRRLHNLEPLHIYRAVIPADRFELEFEQFKPGAGWGKAALQESTSA